nr:hypothetical protein [Bradyrhizobium zhanjiangense]
MRRLLVIPSLLASILGAAPCFAQARAQLGPLCTTETPADQMIDAASPKTSGTSASPSPKVSISGATRCR